MPGYWEGMQTQPTLLPLMQSSNPAASKAREEAETSSQAHLYLESHHTAFSPKCSSRLPFPHTHFSPCSNWHFYAGLQSGGDMAAWSGLSGQWSAHCSPAPASFITLCDPLVHLVSRIFSELPLVWPAAGIYSWLNFV
jgi:hypothetical protein